MSLNIKNERTHDLARQLANITGESLTEAVTVAIEERISRVRRESKEEFVERWMAIGRDTAKRMKEPWKSTPHGDLLYDERGLPK